MLVLAMQFSRSIPWAKERPAFQRALGSSAEPTGNLQMPADRATASSKRKRRTSECLNWEALNYWLAWWPAGR